MGNRCAIDGGINLGSSWCAIRTYAAHAEEMGTESPLEPIFFLKPPGSMVESPEHNPVTVELSGNNRIQHEVELVLRIGGGINPVIEEICVGLDLTDRIIQSEAKEGGLPWTRAKSFKGSAVVGNWQPIKIEDIPSLHHGWRLELSVNGESRTTADTSTMLHSPLDLLTSLSKWAPLRKGDLIFTGTPRGVGWLNDGDLAEATLINPDGEVKSSLRVHFSAPSSLK